MKNDPQNEIRARLRDSLDFSVIRFGLWLLALAYGLFLLLLSRGSRDVRIVMTVFITVAIGAGMLAVLYQRWKLLRRPEGYVFCEAELCQPHHEPMTRGCFKFCAVIETEQEGRFLVETRPIFISHGFGGPLMEDYLGKTVTIAWNRETDAVVVIG